MSQVRGGLQILGAGLHRDDIQRFLDSNGRALIDGDFALFRRQVAVPTVLISSDRSQYTLTEDLLRARFKALNAALAAMGVTDLIRPVYSIVDYGGGMVTAQYDTHAISGSRRVLPVFSSQMVLKTEDDRLLCVAIISGLRQDHDFWKTVPTRPDEEVPE
jgi:hypothetical protein